MPSSPFARSHIEDYLHGEEPWAVVTGATDGIGKATAISLLSKGFNVLLHGRNPTKLSTTLTTLQSLHPSRKVASIQADFSSPTPENLSIIPSYITFNNLRVTLFINNVASTDNGVQLFSDTPEKEVDKGLNTGVVFFTKLCHAMIPLMREERVEGKAMMVNMGSAAAELPIPYVGVYSGTKGYMLSFTPTLATEALMTSSTLTFLYIDIHTVSTPANNMPISTFVPSASHFAESLIFAIGQRKHQGKKGRGGRGGAHVLVTPYWAHKLERVMIGLVPRGMVEKLTIGKMKNIRDAISKKPERN